MAGERTNGHVRWTQPESENPSGEMCPEGSSSEPAADEQEEKPALMRATGGRGRPPCPDGRAGGKRGGWAASGTVRPEKAQAAVWYLAAANSSSNSSRSSRRSARL